MKFSRLVSTIILATTFACIFLFVCVFWFYSSADNKTLGLLKDSLSTTSGFFGGIATLTAAYIASKLFNDWKDQHKTNFYEKFYYDLRDKTFQLYEHYKPIKEILLDKNNDKDDLKLLETYHKLTSDFLVHADYINEILMDFIYLLKKEDNPLYKTFILYGNDLNETITLFRFNDPLLPENKHIRNHLIEKYIEKCLAEKGVLNLKALLSLDLLDSILLKLK